MAKGWKVGPKGGKLDQRVESWTKGWKVGPKGGKLERWKFCFVMRKFHMSPCEVVWKIFFSYSIRRKMFFFFEVLSPSDLGVVFFVVSKHVKHHGAYLQVGNWEVHQIAA